MITINKKEVWQNTETSKTNYGLFFYILTKKRYYMKKIIMWMWILWIICIILWWFIRFSDITQAKEEKTLCKSTKCEIRLKFIKDWLKVHKTKEAIIDYSMIRLIKIRKEPLNVSEFRNIKNEVSKLYDLYAKTKTKILHKGWNKDDEKQKILNKLYQISSWDLDFVWTVLWENWNLNKNLRSYIVWANWYYDYWLCQINKGYHKEIVNHKDFYNLDFQIQKCWELYKWGTKFYGKKHKDKMISNLEIRQF